MFSPSNSGAFSLPCPFAGHLCAIPLSYVPRTLSFCTLTVPAGFPSPAQDEVEEPIDLGEWLVDNPAASYVMRVSGSSMLGAGVVDGDLIVVSRAVQPRAGHIVVAVVHGDRMLKRLRKIEGRLRLVAEADGYPEVLVDEHVEVWGVAVGLARRFL